MDAFAPKAQHLKPILMAAAECIWTLPILHAKKRNVVRRRQICQSLGLWKQEGKAQKYRVESWLAMRIAVQASPCTPLKLCLIPKPPRHIKGLEA